MVLDTFYVSDTTKIHNFRIETFAVIQDFFVIKYESSDHLIFGNFNLVLCDFDIKEACYSRSKIKPELPEIWGSEDTC